MGSANPFPLVSRPPTNIIGWWPGDNTAHRYSGREHMAPCKANAGFGHGPRSVQAFTFGGGKRWSRNSRNNRAWDFWSRMQFTIDTWLRLDCLHLVRPLLVAHETNQQQRRDGTFFPQRLLAWTLPSTNSNAAQVFSIYCSTLKQVVSPRRYAQRETLLSFT